MLGEPTKEGYTVIRNIFFFASLVVGVLLVSFVQARVRSASQPEAVVKALGFECPYCHVDVTGYAELDRINHVSCINKSEVDLEAERNKPKPASLKDEYFSTYETFRTDWNGQYNSKYSWNRNSTQDFSRVEYTLYRNGKEIATGSVTTKGLATTTIDGLTDLDKHKRRYDKKV